MIPTKYLIIIGAVVCLLILYYFYNEISSIKKLFIPSYQKTMALEAKLFELEKKATEYLPKKKLLNQKNDSPVLSITYQSDMVKNGNLSVKYVDLSDTEARELLKNIEENKKKNMTTNAQSFQKQIQENQEKQLNKQILLLPDQSNKKIFNVQPGELSDFVENNDQSQKKINDMYDDYTDTINVKFTDLVGKKSEMDTMDTMDNYNSKNEYQKILNGLSNNICSVDGLDDDGELDQDIIRSISESIHYADMPSETVLSDIPENSSVQKRKSKKTFKKEKQFGQKNM